MNKESEKMSKETKNEGKRNWFSEEERHKIWKNLERKELSMKNIYLDPQNPRIRVKKAIPSDSVIPQKDIQEHCQKQIDEDGPAANNNLEEKLLSMGFRTEGDALYVRPLKDEDDKNLALEGNRRTRFVKKILSEIEDGLHEEKSIEWKNSFDQAYCLVYTGDNPHAAAILQSNRHLGGGKSSDWNAIRRAEHYKLIRDSAVEAGKPEPSAHEIAEQMGETDSSMVRKLLQSLSGQDAANKILTKSKKFVDQNGFGWFNEVIFQGDKRLREGYLGWNTKTGVFDDSDNLKKLAEMINSTDQITSQSVFRDKIKLLFDADGTPVAQWENMETDSNYTLDQAVADINAEKKQAAAEKKKSKTTLAGYNSELGKLDEKLKSLPTGKKGGVKSSQQKTLEKTITLCDQIIENAESTRDTVQTFLNPKDTS